MSGSANTPLELCGAAERLVADRAEASIGVWPRAAALLTRQALELALGVLWARRAPGTELAPIRAQLAALGSVLRDERLAGRVSFTWWSLTRACHFHHYELPPTESELADARATVCELVNAVAERS